MRVYDGYRDGDVALVRARPSLSKWMTYDHAGMIWLARGTWFTVEAGLRGIFPWKGPHWGRGFDVFRVGTPEQGEAAIDAAMTMIGKGYAFSHLLTLFPRILRRDRVTTLGGMICTELVSWSWAQAGVLICPGNPYPTPDEIAEWMAS